MKSKRNKIVIFGALAALSSTLPVQAATLEELSAQIERLQAEVEYLKESAMADRKDTAQKAVTLETLSTTASKYVWSGDFRYRSEHITTANSTVLPDCPRGTITIPMGSAG